MLDQSPGTEGEDDEGEYDEEEYEEEDHAAPQIDESYEERGPAQYDEVCRRDLPPNPNYKRNQSSGKKRVNFQDDQSYTNTDQKMDLTDSELSGTDIDQKIQSIKDNLKNEAMHDESSVQKLEEVLRRQRERLQNMGGLSGAKGNSVNQSRRTDGENIEDAFNELEKEIEEIKRNIETGKSDNRAHGHPMRQVQNYGDYASGAMDIEDPNMSGSDVEQARDHNLAPRF